MKNMSELILLSLIFTVFSVFCYASERREAIIIDHNCTDISKISEKWIEKAKKKFRVWYGHTSHGSQITSGMQAMNKKPFNFNRNGTEDALSYRETGGDLGHKGDMRWGKKTLKKLKEPGNNINLVMWSWCGGCSDNTEEGIRRYLIAMSRLEKRFPDVTFIYMTGHLDGSGKRGNLHRSNNQIREYCRKNNKVLFDFADIESFDPDGNRFLEKYADDACRYRTESGKRANWAEEWLKRNPNHNIDLPSHAAHTHPLNGALKGRAFWWMMARLAGWNGK